MIWLSVFGAAMVLLGALLARPMRVREIKGYDLVSVLKRSP